MNRPGYLLGFVQLTGPDTYSVTGPLSGLLTEPQSKHLSLARSREAEAEAEPKKEPVLGAKQTLTDSPQIGKNLSEFPTSAVGRARNRIHRRKGCMSPNAFAYLARISALRAQFSSLREQLADTTDREERAEIFTDAIETLRRIRELEGERA